MFLVSVTGKVGAVSVAVKSAGQALRQVRSFEADGLRTIVLDDRGREVALDQLKAKAADEERASPKLTLISPPCTGTGS